MMYVLIAIVLLCMPIINAMEQRTITIEKMQILIAPKAPWFSFKAVDNDKIIKDLITPRSEGSTFTQMSLIFPEDTINVRDQKSFLVDKNNVPLGLDNSIGVWTAQGTALVDIDIKILHIPGTCFERSTWTLFFRNTHQPIKAMGTHTVVKTHKQNDPFVESKLSIIEILNDKEKLSKNKIYGNAYVSRDGESFVIEVLLKEPIVIPLAH